MQGSKNHYKHQKSTSASNKTLKKILSRRRYPLKVVVEVGGVYK